MSSLDDIPNEGKINNPIPVETNISGIPSTITLSVFMIAIYILYATKKIQKIPCQDTLLKSFESNFVHVSAQHLIVNIFAFWQLSRVEARGGSKNFVLLLLSLLALQTVGEYAVAKLTKNTKCSIGFSGILYGIAAWELITSKTKNLASIALPMLLVIFLGGGSITGHLIGVGSGVIAGIVTNIIKNKKISM